MGGSICAGTSSPNRREKPTEQSESLSPAKESTWVIVDINRWNLLKKVAPRGEGGAGVVEETHHQGGGALGSGGEVERGAREVAARARKGRPRV